MRWLESGRTVQTANGARSVFAALPPPVVYWRLVRPTLLVAVLASMSVAAVTAPEPPSWSRLAHALLGTGLVIAGAAAANQLAERRRDAAMKRTASRPLPAGLATPRQVAVFATLSTLCGIGCLAAMEPPLLALLAALSWAIYVLVYTPLKRVSVWHIPAGAVAGAMPVLLGAAAAHAVRAPITLALFAVVLCWQFPHTAAIGWIYREQYAVSKIKVAAVVDPSGRLAGRLSLGGAVGLLLASLVPGIQSTAGWPYVAVASCLGLAHVCLAARFLAAPNDSSARALWRASMIHLALLPLTLLLLP